MPGWAICDRLKICVVVLCGGLWLLLSACSEEKPLRVGFVGGLTGRVADLGVAGRDGVTLAIEERNQSGGVAGRPVELIVRDDQQDEKQARQAVQELLDAEVVAIIGHMTSTMSVATVPLLNAAQVVMLSPTTKTDQLTGLDDYFLRVTESLGREAGALARHALLEKPGGRFVVAYDLSNVAYSEAWLKAFQQSLEAGGGQIIQIEGFTSGPEVHLLPIAESLLSQAPDGVLLVCNAIDSALLAQQMSKSGSSPTLYATAWAFTTDLLSFGGRAVHGMVAYNDFNAASQEPLYLEFHQRFTRRFGYKPSFATVLAYDAATSLLAGLEMNPQRAGLRESLLRLKTFQGLQSSFTIDPYGDVNRAQFLTRVTAEGFEIVE